LSRNREPPRLSAPVRSATALFPISKDGLKVWHAVICVLLGFYLASTSIAPGIPFRVSAAGFAC